MYVFLIACLNPETSQGGLLLTWLNFNPACKCNHMLIKVWDQIIHPFQNFNGYTIEVLAMDT